ncbi:MAG: ATP-binding protein [Desulfobacterales bacterium]
MKFTIFKRLTFGYATIMVLVMFLGGYVTLKLNQLNHLTREIAAVDVNTITLCEHLLDKLFSQVGFGKKFLISKDKDFYQKFREIKEHVTQDMQKLKPLMHSDENKKLFSEIEERYDRYLAAFIAEVNVQKKYDDYPRRKYQVEKEKAIKGINQRLKELIRMARTDRDKKMRESSQISSQILKVTSVTAGVAIIIGLFISLYNTQSINRSILLLQKKTKDIANGRFEEIRNVSSPPEIKDLADDFNRMCERLQELDEMKKDFISHVSHKLRTPLTAIKEASGMLLEGTYAGDPTKQRELLTITNEECGRLIDSVNHILDLSRMEAKMMDYQLKDCRLFPVIQRSVLKLAPIAQRKKIDLELKPPPVLPAVKIDAERISQVMENLIGNALKFSAAGSKVVISASCIDDGRKWIEVSVSDSGCGIPKENLGKIFDKFERIDRGKETPRGTGLGLSITKYIIADHGGAIWAQSEPGKGSTFLFTLPVS